MCMICGQTPCHPRCPNADDSDKAVHTCNYCKEPIYEGDEYAENEIDGDKYHIDCLSGIPIKEVMGLFYIPVRTAEKE